MAPLENVIVELAIIITDQRSEIEKLKTAINELQLYKDSKEIPF